MKDTTRNHLVTTLKVIGHAMLVAAMVLVLVNLTSGSQRSLAERVDRNAGVTVSGVAAVVCILNIEPEDRSDNRIDACLDANGFVGVVNSVEVP